MAAHPRYLKENIAEKKLSIQVVFYSRLILIKPVGKMDLGKNFHGGTRRANNEPF